jgi:sugar lactone lactonase YvrE
MRVEHMGVALVLGALIPGCVAENQAESAPGTVRKGGDNRNGEYVAAANWWKPAPDHTDGWSWGLISGVVADNPNRIIVSSRSDRNAAGEERPNSSNHIVVVDGNGNITENWTQWDTLVAFPHQLYISPYDPERHIWVVERGGGERNVHEQVLKFTNDGQELVLRLLDPMPRQSEAEARANKNPGPLDYGQASTLAFLPNGDFLLGDGYQNGRIIRYNAEGEFVSEFGSVGTGPSQFDLIHGVGMDRDHRIYVSDRDNNRIQVFTEDGEFIEEWPDIMGPTGIHVDESEDVWVISTTLNQVLKYKKNGELQHSFGAYCCTRGGFVGGLSRPHQMAVDQDGNVYIANYDGGYVTKFTPRPDADPSKLIGQPLVLER